MLVHRHTAEYLKGSVEGCLDNLREVFDFHFCGFVTDNTGNVAKLRRQLDEGTLVDTRWNSMICAFEAYIECWPALFTICDTHRSEITPDIMSIAKNIMNKRLVRGEGSNIETYFYRLR